MATYSPFLPWKHAQRVWKEARRRGFEVVVCLDDRTSSEDQRHVMDYADQIIRWKSQGHVEDAYVHVQRCSGEYVLMIADDEEPSPLCWDFAEKPPFPGRFAFPVIPVVSDLGKSWAGDYGLQERLIFKQGWRWIPRVLPDGTMTTFEGHPEGATQVSIRDNPGAIIWHYLLDAPLEEREEKAQRYALIDQSSVSYHMSRLLWEDRPELLQDIPPSLAAQLPKENA